MPRTPVVAVGAKITASKTNVDILRGNVQGLTAITPTSVAGAGVTITSNGSVNVAAGSTTASINGVFTSEFTNYLFICSTIFKTSATDLLCRLRSGGVDNTSALYATNRMTVTGTTTTNFNSTAVQFWNVDAGALASSVGETFINFLNPFGGSPARAVMQGATYSTITQFTGAAMHNSASGFDGVTFYVSAGTFQTRVRIYGYNDN